MFGFIKVPLARQFLVISFIILLTGMVIIGLWISAEIRNGVLTRTAAITALYVDSFISPHLQTLANDDKLPTEDLGELDRLLLETPLGQQIVSFKVWSLDGTILYSPNRELVGLSFEIDEEMEIARSGIVVSTLSQLNRAEHENERQQFDSLIETYAPVRKESGEEVIAISEFYQKPDDLKAEIRIAQNRSWLVIGAATFTMYILLAGIVGRASNTILSQQFDLENQLTQLRTMLGQNEQLHRKVRRAGARTTALNERFLRRISADLHDGLGQDLTLALMRTDSIRESFEEGDNQRNLDALQHEDLEGIHISLVSAVKELRETTSGLRLPEIENLSISKVATRAIHDFQSKTGTLIDFSIDDPIGDGPYSVKITVYRVLQEALANAYRHAGGSNPDVKIWQEDSFIKARVTDRGKGFNMHNVTRDNRLGLAGMRERVELLGGIFSIETTPGQGTVVEVTLPLYEDSTSAVAVLEPWNGTELGAEK